MIVLSLTAYSFFDAMASPIIACDWMWQPKHAWSACHFTTAGCSHSMPRCAARRGLPIHSETSGLRSTRRVYPARVASMTPMSPSPSFDSGVTGCCADTTRSFTKRASIGANVIACFAGSAAIGAAATWTKPSAAFVVETQTSTSFGSTGGGVPAAGGPGSAIVTAEISAGCRL